CPEFDGMLTTISAFGPLRLLLNRSSECVQGVSEIADHGKAANTFSHHFLELLVDCVVDGVSGAGFGVPLVVFKQLLQFIDVCIGFGNGNPPHDQLHHRDTRADWPGDRTERMKRRGNYWQSQFEPCLGQMDRSHSDVYAVINHSPDVQYINLGAN